MADVTEIRPLEEIELDELERHTAQLTEIWVRRLLVEFEESGTANIRETAERARHATDILTALDRLFEEIREMREAREHGA